MAFKKDIPEYKSYSEENFYMHSVPGDVWSELSGLIGRYADNASILRGYLNRFSEIIPCEQTKNWGWEFLVNDISSFVGDIRRKVERGHFEVFMDCVAILIDGVHERVNDINDFFEEHKIGYICDLEPFSRQVIWNVRDESDIVDELVSAKSIVKTVSQQAYEEIERAIKTLESAPQDERARKDVVRSCVSAMEAVVKEYGKDDDIKKASKNLRDEQIWGSDRIVKDGDAIFSSMHHDYPDLRHGSIETSKMPIEEAEYWISRIAAYLKYMRKMASKNGQE